MSFYPDDIVSPKFAGKVPGANAVGTSASFLCGSFVRFYLNIDRKGMIIREAGYTTNGCRYAIAGAERMAGFCTGKPLTELGGLAAGDVSASGDVPAERGHCGEMSLDALREALSDFRSMQIEEFTGEKALICTCFGVDEETIERVIEAGSLENVSDVTARTNAGGGCGSCRMLIQEMIDGHALQRR